jgi:hypothetical protein
MKDGYDFRDVMGAVQRKISLFRALGRLFRTLASTTFAAVGLEANHPSDRESVE